MCIHQNDIDERGTQVAIMADIYRHAVRTVGWLGKADGDSHLAMRILEILADEPSSLIRSGDKYRTSDQEGQSLASTVLSNHRAVDCFVTL